jgi:hypothetical protein
VSSQLIQILEIMGLALCAFSLVLYLSRKQRLSFRYTIGWMVLSVFTFLGALVVPFIEPISEFLRIGPFAVVGAICLFVLLSICIQLSISISGMQRQISKLNEDSAMLRNMIEKFDVE